MDDYVKQFNTTINELDDCVTLLRRSAVLFAIAAIALQYMKKRYHNILPKGCDAIDSDELLSK